MKEWRQTLAKDKTLSAKEKTRLRNKISALVSRKNRKLEHQKLQAKSSDQERNQLMLLSALDEVLTAADKEKVRLTLMKKKQEAAGCYEDEEDDDVSQGGATVTESEEDEKSSGENNFDDEPKIDEMEEKKCAPALPTASTEDSEFVSSIRQLLY